MKPNRKSITPLSFCILGIRLIALLLFFASLSSVGYLLVALTDRTPTNEIVAGPHAAILLVYAIVLMIFTLYPGPIARVLSRGLPRFAVQSRWTRVELVAAILAAVAVYEILASLGVLLNQLYGIFSRYQELVGEGGSEKERFNLLLFGLLGTFLKIGVAGLVFVKSGRLAVLWNRWQSPGGLRNSLRERVL